MLCCLLVLSLSDGICSAETMYLTTGQSTDAIRTELVELKDQNRELRKRIDSITARVDSVQGEVNRVQIGI